MGKTFVEDERPCDLCVNVTRYGCVSWNCEYINRDEAIKAWREKHEMADRKTEPTQNQHIQSVESVESVGEDRKTDNSSEKPNNCKTEPRKEQNFCGKCRYLYRDFKYGLSCYRLMDNEPCKYEERKESE